MRTKTQGLVLGLDLSLRHAGAVLVPLDWDCDFKKVQTWTCGGVLGREATELAKYARCEDIANGVLSFLRSATLAGIFVEDYAYGMATGSHQLGELRGVVRRALVGETGKAPTPVNIMTARKTFFGKLPKLKRDALKKHILSTVNSCGATFETDDLADAFLVANYGMTEFDRPAMTLGAS